MAFLTCEKSRKTMLFTDEKHGLMLKRNYSSATTSISTNADLGRVLTATAERAG